MKRIIITYGLISGIIVSLMLYISMPLMQKGLLSYTGSMIVGYTSMIIAFALIFFGIKNYRDNHQEGLITFGKGFQIGILITIISALVYAISWEVYYSLNGDAFNKWYAACQVDKLVKDGVSGAALDKAKVKLDQEIKMYGNLFVRFGFTFMEIFLWDWLLRLSQLPFFVNEKCKFKRGYVKES